MKVHRSPQARADLDYWEENDPKISARIDAMLQSIKETPFKGIGKPEPLKYERPLGSRRTTKEHRLVYFFKDGELYIVAARYHYTTI